ncbi:MAG: flippase-like domain-containing protein [Anaerolineales bacterium]|nr:flippase-like domain-containing protein [Anaerolineales bacterium]
MNAPPAEETQTGDLPLPDGDVTTQPTFLSRKVIWPVLAILAIGAGLVLWDGKRIAAVLQQADWHYLPGALLFTAFSYLCVSYTYTMVARIFGIRMPGRDLTEIGFITTSLNHVVRSGGLAGYSVRYFLMSLHGVPLSEVLSSSFVHYYLTSIDMLVMLPVAIIYVLTRVEVVNELRITLTILVTFYILFTILFTYVVFSNSLRAWLLDRFTRFQNRLAQRRGQSPGVLTRLQGGLIDFNNHVAVGLQALRQETPSTSLVVLLTFVDWVSSAVVVGLCFDAFGPALKPGAIIASFMIGVMAGVLSAIPGGIGVQEGSMAGIGMLFGATFEQAILASLLFRVIYYFVPYAITPLFYPRLLHQPKLETSG